LNKFAAKHGVECDTERDGEERDRERGQ